MSPKQTHFQQPPSTKGEEFMMNTLNNMLRTNFEHTEKIKALCLFMFAFFVFSSQAFGVANTNDAGFTQSTTNLVSIINNSLVPITLIAGCLASAALAFIKSSPAPFVIAILTTISFGFAKIWINTTYAICV